MASSHKWIVVVKPTGRLDVRGEHGNPTEGDVVLVSKRAGRDKEPSLVEVGLPCEMRVLEPVKLLSAEFRRIFWSHQEQDRMTVEEHGPSSRRPTRSSIHAMAC